MQLLPSLTSADPDTAVGCDYRPEKPTRRPGLYGLTLILTGITADDYLQWIRDPDPPHDDRLRLISARVSSPGDRVQLELIANREPPTPEAAALALGFPIGPEIGRAQWTGQPIRRVGAVSD
jgi:hypothetical protein